MNTFKAERVYAKRETEKSDWSGRIGATALVVASESDIVVTLDGQTLPHSSVEYLLNFALQSMQDAYAGADSLNAAIGAFEKKRDAIINGTLGTRGGGDGVGTRTVIARRLVRAQFKAKNGAKSEAWVNFAALPESIQIDKLDAYIERNAEKMRVAVDAELARIAEEAEKKAAIGASMDVDL